MTALPHDRAGGSGQQVVPRTRLGERVAATVLVVATLGIGGTFAWQQGHTPKPAAGAAAATTQVSTTIGFVDAPTSEVIVGTAVRVTGWALDPGGMRGVEI